MIKQRIVGDLHGYDPKRCDLPLSLKLNSHLFQVMVLNLLLPVWRWVTVELPCVNFTEVLMFERSGILVIPETVHRSVFYIGNVLMFAFSVFLFCMVWGH